MCYNEGAPMIARGRTKHTTREKDIHRLLLLLLLLLPRRECIRQRHSEALPPKPSCVVCPLALGVHPWTLLARVYTLARVYIAGRDLIAGKGLYTGLRRGWRGKRGLQSALLSARGPQLLWSSLRSMSRPCPATWCRQRSPRRSGNSPRRQSRCPDRHGNLTWCASCSSTDICHQQGWSAP